jgi:hypothetical protein
MMEQTDGRSVTTGRDFEGWSPELIGESKNAEANGRVGSELLFESSIAYLGD